MTHNIECQKCHKDSPLISTMIICNDCYDKKLAKDKRSIKSEVEYLKKKCRGLERERDKLRSKVFYGSEEVLKQ